MFRTSMLKRGLRAAAAPTLAVGVAGCNEAPPPMTVVVNTPPSDGGPLVLLTVMIAAAFVLAGVAMVCGWGWAAERRARREAELARRDAEDAVLALTGRPLGRARLLIDRSQHLDREWPATGQTVEKWSVAPNQDDPHAAMRRLPEGRQ